MEILAVAMIAGAVALFMSKDGGGTNINIGIGGSKDPAKDPPKSSGPSIGGGGGGFGGFGGGDRYAGPVAGSSGGSDGRASWESVRDQGGLGIPLEGETGGAVIAESAFPGSGGAAGVAVAEGVAAGVTEALYEPGGILGDRDTETPSGFGSTLDDWSPEL